MRFYDEMATEWDLRSSSEIIVSLWDFNDHVGKCAEGFEGAHGGNDIGKRNAEGRRLLEFVMKKSCAWQTLAFLRQTKGKSLIQGVRKVSVHFFQVALIRKIQDCSHLIILTVCRKHPYMIRRVVCGLRFPDVELLALFSS